MLDSVGRGEEERKKLEEAALKMFLENCLNFVENV